MMKVSFKLILSALAATAALTGCTKEPTPGQTDQTPASPAAEGTRVIAVSFAPQTKTTLGEDGLTPKFIGKEMIKVSNGTECKDCEVKVDGEGNATFTTDLEGLLKAVYPSTAAKMNGSEIEGVLVSSVQSGKFADANICMATMTESGGESLTFVNKTAILRFYVDESIGVSEIDIAGGGIAGTSSNISVLDQNKKFLHEVTDGPDKRICYVAVNAGVNAKNLTFTSHTQTQKDVVRKSPVDITLEAGKMYNAFIPYYIDLDGVGKWAYCNIGAFLPEEPGEYFAWGETIGHKLNEGHNFSWANTPFNGANAEFDQTFFNTTKDIVCPNKTLALKYDAANANWGNGWRLPTSGELETLISKTTFDDSSSPAYIFKSESKSVFFPSAGYFNGTTSYKAAPYYWSSTLGLSSYEDKAYMLFADNRAINIGERNFGMTIRPFYDETAILQQSVLLPGEFTVNGEGKKVKFTSGNLYWENNAWKVKNNQCDAGGYFYFSTDAQHSRERNIAGETYSTEDKLFCCEDNSLSINSQEGFFDLSKEEWEYLLKNRSQTNRFARANVNGKQGILIFPDGYQKESEISDVSGIMAVNSHGKSDFPSVRLEPYIWSVMESNGVVFLPMTSYYAHGTYESYSPKVAYWSSTAHPSEEKKDEAYYLFANTTQVNLINGAAAKRDFGYQIRLVQKITAKDQK